MNERMIRVQCEVCRGSGLIAASPPNPCPYCDVPGCGYNDRVVGDGQTSPDVPVTNDESPMMMAVRFWSENPDQLKCTNPGLVADGIKFLLAEVAALRQDRDRVDWLRNHYGSFAGACTRSANGVLESRMAVRWKITNHEWLSGVGFCHSGEFTSTVVHQHRPGEWPQESAALWRDAIDLAMKTHDEAVNGETMPPKGLDLIVASDFADLRAAAPEGGAG